MSDKKLRRSFALSEAWACYEGPEEFAPFADFLPAIGEVVISFGMLEARMRWCKESLLGASIDEAYALEGFVQNFSSRSKFLELAGRALSRETNSELAFDEILSELRSANTFRNRLLHNKFCGVAVGDMIDQMDYQVIKEKFDIKLEKRSYYISLKEMKEASSRNLATCQKIQIWTLAVRPNAQNRVP